MTRLPFNAVYTQLIYKPGITCCSRFRHLHFLSIHQQMKWLNLNRYFVSLCTTYLFSNGSNSLCARLLRLQYFSLTSETREIINMTCQTIEHNDLSLIPLARESLMFLLQKIDLLHIGAALTQTHRAARSESTSNACGANWVLHIQCDVSMHPLHTLLFSVFLGVTLWKTESNTLNKESRVW